MRATRWLFWFRLPCGHQAPVRGSLDRDRSTQRPDLFGPHSHQPLFVSATSLPASRLLPAFDLHLHAASQPKPPLPYLAFASFHISLAPFLHAGEPLLDLCFRFLEQRRFPGLVRFQLRGPLSVWIDFCEEVTPFLPPCLSPLFPTPGARILFTRDLSEKRKP